MHLANAHDMAHQVAGVSWRVPASSRVAIFLRRFAFEPAAAIARFIAAGGTAGWPSGFAVVEAALPTPGVLLDEHVRRRSLQPIAARVPNSSALIFAYGDC